MFPVGRGQYHLRYRVGAKPSESRTETSVRPATAGGTDCDPLGLNTMIDWTYAETNTHQDHVIAHVIGATVVGYFVFDETAFLLLDIGFIWHVYLDGEMGLRPHPVAVAELEMAAETKTRIQNEVDAALQQRPSTEQFLKRLPNSSPIQTVDFLVRENSRRLRLTCEERNIVVEMSLDTCEVRISTDYTDYTDYTD